MSGDANKHTRTLVNFFGGEGLLRQGVLHSQAQCSLGWLQVQGSLLSLLKAEAAVCLTSSN